jgi:hypothetical protein
MSKYTGGFKLKDSVAPKPSVPQWFKYLRRNAKWDS